MLINALASVLELLLEEKKNRVLAARVSYGRVFVKKLKEWPR
jgi:hypothetical protein